MLKIQDNMFTFDNLAGCDNRSIQTLSRNVEPDMLMVALKGGAIVEVPLAEVGGKNRSIDLSYPPLFPHFD